MHENCDGNTAWSGHLSRVRRLVISSLSYYTVIMNIFQYIFIISYCRLYFHNYLLTYLLCSVYGSCPYRHASDSQLTALLGAMKIGGQEVKDIVTVAKAGNYQVWYYMVCWICAYVHLYIVDVRTLICGVRTYTPRLFCWCWLECQFDNITLLMYKWCWYFCNCRLPVRSILTLHIQATWI